MALSVKTGESCLVPVGGGERRQYSFPLTVQEGGAPIHTVLGRYSELRRSCRETFAEHAFPSRHRLRNCTKNEKNVQLREEELRQFFEQCLNDEQGLTSLLRSEDVLAALGVTADEARAELERLAAVREEGLLQQQKGFCSRAQEFNKIEAYSSIPAGLVAPLVFEQRQVLQFPYHWWSCADASVTGPAALPWFQVKKIKNDTMGDTTKCQFNICSESGEPLLLLNGEMKPLAYKFNLYRVDPRDLSQPVHVCRVSREGSSSQFGITLLMNKMFEASSSGGKLTFNLSGGWPRQLALKSEGKIRATVSKGSEDLCQLEIMGSREGMQNDCLVFVGIVFAIHRINEELCSTHMANHFVC